ncbi:MAG: DUF4349 domain-containing protein [Defluviitaleaceae bacterium]|nr:DUF4349 domain-containing protein [Defluviitaleaceae bacterium]
MKRINLRTAKRHGGGNRPRCKNFSVAGGLLAGIFALAAMVLSACAGQDHAIQRAPMFITESAADADHFDRLTAGIQTRPEMSQNIYFGTFVGDSAVSEPTEPGRGRVDAPVGSAVLSNEAGGIRDNANWEDVAEHTEQRHIIQNAAVEMETEAFDEVVTLLRDLANRAGGYAESEMLTRVGAGRFTIVMRVPAASFSEVLTMAESLADVRTSSQTAQDVTDSFYDMISSLETRRIEEDRLLALIDDAENIHDLLALETRLTNTRMSIETYLSQLNNLAGQIAFSTITVTLFDVSEEAPPVAAATFGERVGNAFGSSVGDTTSAFENIVVFFAGAIIPLAIFGLFGLVVYLFIKRLTRRTKASEGA